MEQLYEQAVNRISPDAMEQNEGEMGIRLSKAVSLYKPQNQHIVIIPSTGGDGIVFVSRALPAQQPCP